MLVSTEGRVRSWTYLLHFSIWTCIDSLHPKSLSSSDNRWKGAPEGLSSTLNFFWPHAHVCLSNIRIFVGYHASSLWWSSHVYWLLIPLRLFRSTSSLSKPRRMPIKRLQVSPLGADPRYTWASNPAYIQENLMYGQLWAHQQNYWCVAAGPVADEFHV